MLGLHKQALHPHGRASRGLELAWLAVKSMNLSTDARDVYNPAK